MNYLSPNQISFTEMYYGTDSSSFKMGFISRRLKKLIDKKIQKQEWRVMTFDLDPKVIDYPGYISVFTCPSKRSVLFTIDKIFSFRFNRKQKRWQEIF